MQETVLQLKTMHMQNQVSLLAVLDTVGGKCFILEVLPAFGNISSLQINDGCSLHEWEGVLHIQFAIHIFSKCVLSEFTYLNVLYVHLLECNYPCNGPWRPIRL
jgi:hypothetical protein